MAPVLATAFAAFAAMGSCIAVPPADLPPGSAGAPVIIQGEVQPPANQVLSALPAEFIVPVRVTGPTIDCKAFVDFDPGVDNSTQVTGFVDSCPLGTLPASDGGLTILHFALTAKSLGDPALCHVIQFFVAAAFDPNSIHTAAGSLGADSVTWQYAPKGPGGCLQFDDAGDGAFPDAPPDGLLLVQDVIGHAP